MSTRLGWLLMLSLALTVFSIRQWREATNQRDSANLARLEATRQRDTADAARLAAQAQWKLDEHFDEALLLATEGVQRVRTSETTQALLAVLARLPSQRPFLRGHAGSVASVAFSPDGGLLATGSDDGTVILWDVTTRQPAGAPLEGHADPVTSVAFSPDGTLLATGSKDRG
jgi:WD40 repeat protein